MTTLAPPPVATKDGLKRGLREIAEEVAEARQLLARRDSPAGRAVLASALARADEALEFYHLIVNPQEG